MARIAFVEVAGQGDWRLEGGRFAGLAARLKAVGHDVVLVESPGPTSAAENPVLTPLNRATAATALSASNRLAHKLALDPPDLLVAPLSGGVAQGVLNARACGEGFGGTRVVLWCDLAQRLDPYPSDSSATGVAPLIADALERQCIVLADLLIVPEGREDISEFVRGAGGGSISAAPSPTLLDDGPPSRVAPETVEEVVFVGPFVEGNGAAEFVYAIEALVRDGLMDRRRIAFLGPLPDNAAGVGATWLGLRAQQSAYRFSVLSDMAAADARRYLAQPGRLGVMVTRHPDEAAMMPADRPNVTISYCGADRRTVYEKLLDALRAAIESGSSAATRREGAGDLWCSIVERALGARAVVGRGSAADGVSVCILHRDRPEFLRKAIDSVPESAGGAAVDLVVVDNASGAEARKAVRKMVAARAHGRLIELPMAEPFARAHNRGLEAARRSAVIFHDDDNAFAPGGVERLWHAIDVSRFDVVVTPLDVFDEEAQGIRHAGRLIFLGAAHSAGLFFNGFGDTSMIVRRDAFSAAGGFVDLGYPYPCADWATLAQAQARGLRIGALQWAAVRYRRDMARADLSSQKLDQEGARSIVREVYGTAFDASLVARAAQTLHLRD